MASKKAEPVYRYSVEIAQMAYVFGQIREPDDSLVQYIEEVVRSQLSEIVRALPSLSTCTGLTLCTGYSSSSAGGEERSALPCCRGPHLPYPPRPRQGQPLADVPQLEGRAEEGQGVRGG